MIRTLIVREGSSLLAQKGTERVHTYPNGDILVRMASPAGESSRDDEVPIRTGLSLSGISVPETTSKKHEDPAFAKVAYLAYVVLAGPPAASWLSTLAGAGLTLVRYQPFQTYLARGSGDVFAKVAQLRFVSDIVDLVAALKPAVRVAEAGTTPARVLAHAGADEIKSVIDRIAALHGVAIVGNKNGEALDGTVSLDVEIDAEGREALLAEPFVLAIEDREERALEDERANLIVAGSYSATGRPEGSYLRWLEEHGVNGAGVAIGVVDAGVDVSHPAFTGRVTDLAEGRKSWHGTFVAGHAAGAYLDERDPQKFIYGLGVAPKAEIIVQDNTKGPKELCRETVTSKGPSGARGVVQNNSWGQGQKSPMDYGSLEAAYDSLVRNADPDGPAPLPLVICFSAGNSGPQGLTRPKAAKNVIVTGNSENYRPDVGKAESDDINDVFTGAHASSHGNCGDLRVRPDIVVPGEWTASAGYDVHPGQREYLSDRLTWGSGTSAASPKTAGACALIMEDWRKRNGGRDPSPAMVRALLVNGAIDMGAGGPAPNKLQGWGRLHLGNVLAPQSPKVVSDQETFLRERGDVRTWAAQVADPSLPVRVTLAWTDPPGPINSGTEEAPAIVNQLVLRVSAQGREYYGNRMEGGRSVSGPYSNPDLRGRDNLQNVILPAGEAGDVFTIVVEALGVTTDCMTNRPGELRQDFALVIGNARKAGSGQPPQKPVTQPPAPQPQVLQPQALHPSPPSIGGWWAEIGGSKRVEAIREGIKRPSLLQIASRPSTPVLALQVGASITVARPRAPLTPAGSSALSAKRLASIPPMDRANLLALMARPELRSRAAMVRTIRPARVSVLPIVSGDHTLWVDPASDVALYAPNVLRLDSFALTVRRRVEEGGAISITGATALLQVGFARPIDARELADLDRSFTASIAGAGLPSRSYRFQPLTFSAVTPTLVLPDGHALSVQTSAGDPPGSVTYCVELSGLAAQSFSDALAGGSGSSLPGVCVIRCAYAAQHGTNLRAGEHRITTSLGALLTGRGAADVTVVNPRREIIAPVIIDRCEHVDIVTVVLTPSEGAEPAVITCGPDGVTTQLTLRSERPEAISIAWSAEIRFRYPGFPAARSSGTLSVAQADWALMLAPGSLVRKVTVAAGLLDELGNPVVAPPHAEPAEDALAVGMIALPAAPGELEPPAPTTFRAVVLEVHEVVLPLASEPSFHVYAFRGGQQNAATWTLRANESFAVALVDTEAKIRITTDQTPTGESSREGDLLSSLHQIAAKR